MPKTIAVTPTAAAHDTSTSFLDEITARCDKMMGQYWTDNPDLYRMVPLKNQETLAANTPVKSPESPPQDIVIKTPDTMSTPFLLNEVLRGTRLRAHSRENQQHIRECVLAEGADIIPRTQAHNRKSDHHSLEEAREFRADIVAAQIQS